MGQVRCRNDCRISDFHTVMNFITLFQAAQDRYRIFDGGLFYQDFLEAPLECRVFFKILAVLIQRRCPDTMQLTPRQRRFEHVAGIH